MTVIRDILPITLAFADDGLVPNNSLPFVVYKSVVVFDEGPAEDTIERLFGANAVDLSLRPAAARAGYDQGKALASRLTDFCY